MKKIILLVGFILFLVFPPKAWDQTQNSGYGGAGAEYMRQMQQQTNDQKGQGEAQHPQNKTDDFQQKQFGKSAEMKDREAKQKQNDDLKTDKTQDKN